MSDNFTDKLDLDRAEASDAAVVFMLNGIDQSTGEPGYIYLAVSADRLREFQQALDSGSIVPDDYGVIIAQGPGEPSGELKQEIEKEYGFRHDQALFRTHHNAANGDGE